MITADCAWKPFEEGFNAWFSGVSKRGSGVDHGVSAIVHLCFRCAGDAQQLRKDRAAMH
jgi:hypothetical protein